MSRQRYRAYGLEIASDLALHAFAPGRDADAEVEVAVGAIAELHGEGIKGGDVVEYRNWIAREGLLDLDIPGVARMRIEDGRRIRVQPAPGRDLDDVVAHVQGSGFAALLQQRGIVSMHAGTFETGQGAVLIVGTSGAGKSTLLNAMIARGHRMLSDDVTPIAIDPAGRPLAIPAFPATRLWRDSAEQRGHDVARLRRVHGALDKYYVDVPGFRDTPQAIAAVIVIGIAADGEPRHEILPPGDRIKALVRYTYRKHYLRAHGQQDLQFAAVRALAEHARVIKLWRPAANATPDALAAMALEALGCAPAAAECFAAGA